MLQGLFYEDELQKVANDDGVFYVEKVIRKRTNKKGEKEEFVKWMGYPEKFNSWISTKDVVNSFESIDDLDIDKLENNNNRIQFSV